MSLDPSPPHSLAVVIPCYRERAHIDRLLGAIPPEVSFVYCVDDACPEGTGDHVLKTCRDPRVKVIRHAKNLGVGGATVTGYRAALADKADIVVKLDGDGQMDPALIPKFVEPILEGKADYTKGNRFYSLAFAKQMPTVRKIGNAALSFLSKFSTGYWRLFDPNNGYTAIHAKVLRLIPLEKLDRGFFFEPDLLFRLNTLRAAVLDIPLVASYGNEQSFLSVPKIIPHFLVRHSVNFFKRIFYNYFLRDFSIASIEWVLGPVALIFGFLFGLSKWVESIERGISATSGTVMVAALSVIVGLQLTLAALSFDIERQPTSPIHPLLRGDEATSGAGGQIANVS